MSYAVVRGAPTKSQLHLDGIISQLVQETGRDEDRYSLAKIIFKCLRDHPQDIRQIECNSGEVDTNEAVLGRSVRVALALRAAGLKPGDVTLVISRNTLEMSALYFGAMFSGVVLYVLHIGSIAYEIKHFLGISKPAIVFVESDTLPHMEQALRESSLDTRSIILGQNKLTGHQSFAEFISGFDDKVNDFWPVDTERNDPVLIFSTSGSTGLPKAAVLNNRGLVAHLPTMWSYHDKFPTPTSRCLCTTTPSWASHTVLMTGTAVYRITILTTTATITGEHLRTLITKYRPTIALMPGHFGSALVNNPDLERGDLSSIELFVMGGSAIPGPLIDKVKSKLEPSAHVGQVYGMTETQGFVTIPTPGMPKNSLGAIINLFEYKIVDTRGNELGPNEPGELYLKTKECLFSEYIQNKKAYDEQLTEDGWLKSGDKVYMDENEYLFFVERIKFLIKYKNHHVSPSEVEEVIFKIEGVEAVAVCEAEQGPAALVVPRPGFKLEPKHIHDAVNSTLSDAKKLRGGVVFVPSIPLSVNSKIERAKVNSIFRDVSKDCTIMSYAVVRGAPTKSQLHLDGIISQLVQETGRDEDRFSLAKIIFKCLRDHPQDIRQIEGNSGEVDTNEAVLGRSVRVALALRGAGLKPGDVTLVISRNTLEMSALYFGAMFSGVVLYVLHIGSMAHEIKHFLGISKPAIVFVESDTLPHMEQALRESSLDTRSIILGQNKLTGHQSFAEFISGFDDKVNDFWPVDTERNDPVLIFSTSGSTGLPKAAVLNNRGLIAQLPTVWTYHDKFPTPTSMSLCTTTPSWVSHTVLMTATPVYRITLLTTTANVTGEHLRTLITKYKPTIAFMPGHFGSALVNDPELKRGDLSSLELFLMGGSAIPEPLIDKVKSKLEPSAHVGQVYGMTEMQGCVTIHTLGMPKTSLGAIVNLFEFKIVDTMGNELGPNQPGELYLKTKECLFNEYVQNKKAYEEQLTEDGWFKSGDKVYMDEKEYLFFVERIKFLIKYKNHHISPSEVEEVIFKVEGVEAVAVCDAEQGPAALVVPRPGYKLEPKHIHDAVNSTLSDAKKLRGGVVFVPSIPLSVNSKIERAKVNSMFKDVSKDQTCTPGASYKVDCNHCHCTADGVPLCTKMLCLDKAEEKFFAAKLSALRREKAPLIGILNVLE